MKFTNINLNNSILSKHYSEYLEMLDKNGGLHSKTTPNLDILSLYDPKYNLTEFDIYKYIVANDFLKESLSCDKYSLTEGITYDKNKYNNILIDLFYKNIPSDIINQYPISIIFNIKQEGQIIKDLTKKDISSWYGKMYWNPYSYEGDDINFYQELKSYKSKYSGYAGNSYTYYIFKQLIKLILTEVYLYNYNGHILTYNELLYSYNFSLNKTDPQSIKSISELLETGDITKVKYQCIKVTERSEPEVINYLPISELKLFLIDVDKSRNLEESYNSLVEKDFSEFWDYEQEALNKKFNENLIEYKKNVQIN